MYRVGQTRAGDSGKAREAGDAGRVGARHSSATADDGYARRAAGAAADDGARAGS